MSSKPLQKHNFQTSEGHSIFFEKVGTGFPILCFPGYACTNYNFKPLIPYLTPEFTLVLVEYRGIGRSSPAKSEYLLENLVEDGISIMKQLGYLNFGLIGISMGGFLAQIGALTHQKMVKFIALISTKSGGDAFPVGKTVTEESFTNFYNMPAEIGNRFAIEAFVHPTFKEREPEALEALIKLRSEVPIDLAQSLIQLRASWRFLESAQPLENIQCPTLIIHGEFDSFLVPENAHILHQAIPNAQLEFIKDTSHLCFLENPEQVGTHIKNFYQQRVS